MGWDEEFLSADTWVAGDYSGPSTCKYYPKLEVEMVTSKRIADLDTENTEKTAPNNLMGDVSFKFPVTPSLPGWQTSRPCMTHTLQKLSNTMPSASSGTSMPNTKHQHQASSTGSSAPPRIQISQQPPPPHSRQLNRSQFQPPLRVLDSVIYPTPNLYPWQSTKTKRDTVTHLLTRSSQSRPTPSSPSVPSPEVVSPRTLLPPRQPLIA